jgi:hypothetical protein
VLVIRRQMNAILVTGQSNARNSGAHLRVKLPDMLIVNTAVGGSSIRDWQKGEEFYLAALQAVASAREDGHVFTGWWHMQGERETANETRAAEYRSLTVAFFRKFGLHAGLEDIPLLHGQLGPQPSDTPRPYWNTVKNAQYGISRDFPQWKLIVTDDIVPYEPVEGPHWTYDGYSEIAQRVIDNMFV